MRGFLAVARREVAERKLVLAAAAFASLIPLALPLARGLSGANALEVRSWMALFLSFAFAGGIAIGLGATMLVASITSRRIGFDFARPVSALAIWGGHVAAAVLLCAATALIIWIPTQVMGATPLWKDLFADTVLSRNWPLLALGGLLALSALFLISHAAALIFRSRSALLAVDAALALATWFGVSAAISRLPLIVAGVPLSHIAIFLPVAAVIALLAAGYASIARGRTEIRTAHGASSLVLWAVVGTAVIASNGYSWWVMAARPADLQESLWANPAASGPWIEVGGSARSAQATFLYNTTTGRFARTVTADWRGPVLSHDGKRSAWIHADAHGGPLPVWTWRLDDPEAQPVSSRIFLNGYPSLLELSADGSRLATMGAGLLSIHDLASDTTLTSARIPVTDRQSVRGLFVGNDRFRIYRTDSATFDILELDVPARTLTSLGRITGLDDLRYFAIDSTASRVIAVDGSDRRMRLFDGRTGAFTATLADARAAGRWPAFLSGGRIVVTERSSAGLLLLLFGTRGEKTAAIPLPAGSQATTGGEPAPGRLIVGIADTKFHYSSWLVDLDAASTRKIADDLRPVHSLWTSIEAGSDATKLFYGPGQRSLVYLDPLTGKRRVLLAGGS